jgi:hypothetical protein
MLHIEMSEKNIVLDYRNFVAFIWIFYGKKFVDGFDDLEKKIVNNGVIYTNIIKLKRLFVWTR